MLSFITRYLKKDEPNYPLEEEEEEEEEDFMEAIIREEFTENS